MALKKIYDENGRQIGTIDDGKKEYPPSSEMPGCALLMIFGGLSAVLIFEEYYWWLIVTIPIAILSLITFVRFMLK